MIIQLLGGGKPELTSKTITSNGTYSAVDEGYYGYDSVEVDVQNGTETTTITTNGTYTPTSPNIGFSSVTVDVPNGTETTTITTNGEYTPTSPNIGFSSVTVNVPEPSGTLNITTNGIKDVKNYASVDVNVEGGSVISPLSVTPSTSAQTITASGGVDGYSPINVSAVDSNIDANILSNNIKNGVTILGITGSLVELDGVETTINPATSTKIVTPYSPHNGFTKVTVPAVTAAIDANIQAGNIKSGVSILGVEGSVTPAPAYYVEYYVNSSNVLTHSPSSSLINLAGVQIIDDEGLFAAYRYNSHITSADFSNIKTLRQRSMTQCFFRATALTSVNFSGLQSVEYASLGSAFYGVSTLTGILDFSSFTTFSRESIGSSDNGSFAYAFIGTSITGINFNNLVDINSDYAFYNAFSGTNLSTVSFPKVQTMTRTSVFSYAFSNCSLLTSLSFPALISTGFGVYTTQFNNMLSGVTGCTVHFPSNLQSVIGSWSSVVNGFGGTSTTVLFDLTATS